MTESDYLAWELAQELRHEYVAGEVFAMGGARLGHNLVAGNAFAALRAALHGGPCRVFSADMRVQVSRADAYLYPDLVVSCPADDLADRRALSLRCAWLIVEVLSDSTAAFDRGDKFAHYRKLPSLTHYLLVDSDQPAIDLFRRGADGLWVLHPLGLDDRLVLDGPQRVEVPVAALYEEVNFDDARPRP
jgi:Uma2 family endonuclease